jgi:hypothetical protein
VLLLTAHNYIIHSVVALHHSMDSGLDMLCLMHVLGLKYGRTWTAGTPPALIRWGPHSVRFPSVLVTTWLTQPSSWHCACGNKGVSHRECCAQQQCVWCQSLSLMQCCCSPHAITSFIQLLRCITVWTLGLTDRASCMRSG